MPAKLRSIRGDNIFMGRFLRNHGFAMPKFNPGDVVQLKSGGPKMTVVRWGADLDGEETVWVTWFDGPRKVDTSIAAAAVKLAD